MKRRLQSYNVRHYRSRLFIEDCISTDLHSRIADPDHWLVPFRTDIHEVVT